MKKIITVSFAVALSATSIAQELKVLSCGLGVPGMEEPQLQAEAISPDGKFVCGAIEMGEGIFIANIETGEVKFTVPEGINDEGAELRCIDNSGLAIGYSGDNGITYSFADEHVGILEGPEGSKGIIGEAMTNDGSLLVGSISSGQTKAAFSDHGGPWTRLPMPPEEEVLLMLKSMPEASAAKRVSGDGKVILGFIGSFQIPCVWVRNDQGEYVPDLFPVRFLKLADEDVNNDDKPLSGISAHFLSLSNNGRYACMLGLIPKEGEDYIKVPMVYDTESKSIKVYSEDQPIDIGGYGLYPSAVSDDGTFIGTIGQPFYGSVGSFIMKAGQSEAELFVEAFPEFYERYEVSDFEGMNVPSGISADGRYITGYVFYSEDYNDYDTPAYYESYVLDRGPEVGAVDNVASDYGTAQLIYSVDGRSLREMTKGMNIVRNSDGSVMKVMKK